MPKTPMTLDARVARLERRIAAYDRTRRKLDDLADTLGQEILDRLERVEASLRLLHMAEEPGAGIGSGRDLEVLKIESDLGLPPVEPDRDDED